jgi:hypothetical protein
MGASNLWFSITKSSLSIPKSANRLDQLVDTHFSKLLRIDNVTNLGVVLEAADNLKELRDFNLNEVLDSILRRKGARAEEDLSLEPDVLTPEWRTMSLGDAAPSSRDFTVVEDKSPDERYFDSTILLKRLRTVTAFVGFSRIASVDDELLSAYDSTERVVPISKFKPNWIPGNESHGEGILIRFSEEMVSRWERQALSRGALFQRGLDGWSKRTNSRPKAWPGMRFLLIHSFSHLIINALSLDSGYSSASINERIYSNDGSDGNAIMAGVLLFTAASDSEGTLGGLVEQGKSERLSYLIHKALESSHLCSSDPLCIEHEPGGESNPLNGAACHACLYLPETSCLNGNRYLDRLILTETLSGDEFFFFGPR